MSTAAVFLDIEKAFDTTWHSGLLYKLSELQLPISLIKLIASFLTKRKFKVSVEGKFSSPRKVVAGVPQGSFLAPLLYILYINDATAAPGIHVALFADDTCVYAIEKHEGRMMNKLQRSLAAVGSWCQRWNIKIN
jgi:retron-type reverse transcriptase